MIQAQSAFFNKGNMLKPWFVNSIDNPVTKKTSIVVKRVRRKTNFKKILLIKLKRVRQSC